VVGSEILKKDNPKKKGHDERFTMARIEKGHGFDPPMAFEFEEKFKRTSSGTGRRGQNQKAPQAQQQSQGNYQMAWKKFFHH